MRSRMLILALVVLLGIAAALVSLGVVRRGPRPYPMATPAPTLSEELALCPDLYEPVCGVDGKTYSNACVAEEQAGVQVRAPGPCP